MLVDAGGAGRALFAEPFDACVIGAGPAGITVARRLAALGWRVALMEGGGLDLEPHSQALYAGEVVGLEYYPLEEARLRMFGGSSMHWGGRCSPLGEADFLPRPYAPLSGWPIRKRDLDPYAAETDRILDLPDPGALGQPFHHAGGRSIASPTTATASLPASARNTGTRSRRAGRSSARSTPTSSTCGSTKASPR